MSNFDLSTRLASSQLGSDEEEDEKELTVERAMDRLGKYEYKVRLMFTTRHHQQLVNKEERKEMLADIDRIQEFASEMRNVDPDGAEEVISLAEKVLTILKGNEYLQDGKKKNLEECLSHAETAGWDSLVDEPWRAQLVAKAARCGYPKAATALASTNDLRQAIEDAPMMQDVRFSTVPEGWLPPKRP
mmetsp:Transcript_10143/g.19866  ORF Transcript_10143/g.19866 Transcript_10143/m.19866 type:complete len:188 (-) Transcript_10143:247-810(-)|eukprot:CAMPEP_0171524398 /NCGR_PEP_ID=MMETSP0959-20130129/9029_1 /TAXON_ID=87120 /ORGANISM="Aurantiochytrium limacinum, Strain ATCCMYA-1381" /LENGTH=187 /DNA_ID=CAMNT_0012065133 /DNA_START=133 /DNA_END=696 /DNA_ORIENTATION=+